ncbi:hypothetical protein ABPG74_002997 [Tetrahymena malaccensis]
MSANWLEQTRSVLENIELLDQTVLDFMFDKLENPKDQVIIDNKLKNLIEMKQSKCMDALILLQDFDGVKKEEMAILEGKKSVSAGSRQPDIWYNFQQRLKDIKEYYKKHQNQNIQVIDKEFLKKSVFSPPYSEPLFSADEQQGKYVDLNVLYYEFLSFDLKKKKKVRLSEEYHIGDYLWYLEKFDAFHEIPLALKLKEYSSYKQYLQNLINYLKEFFLKTQPLTEFSIIDRQIQQDFEYRWKEGSILGWTNSGYEDVIDYSSNELYCKACKKLFTNSSIYAHHLEGKKHKMAQKNLEKDEKKISNLEYAPEKTDMGQEDQDQQTVAEANIKDEQKKKQLAQLEQYIIGLKKQLGEVINETILYVKKKQTRTYQEIEAENQQEKDAEPQSDSEDDDVPYNPKNVPLGPDGKPIPYWLYKLHQLGIEYKCEICGNYSYWGRRAFEKHFSEWRHSYGMKCLKIPNTIHFKEITSIKDALALHHKLSMESEYSQFNIDQEEEYEDSDGNILNKKTYNDLKKQGLL